MQTTETQEINESNKKERIVLRGHHLVVLQEIRDVARSLITDLGKQRGCLPIDNDEFRNLLVGRIAPAYKKLGYNEELVETMVDIYLKIMTVGTTGDDLEIVLTPGPDDFCEQCEQDRGDHCNLDGINIPHELIREADSMILDGTNGKLDIGFEAYSPEYIRKNLDAITWPYRKAVLILLLKNPGLMIQALIKDFKTKLGTNGII